MAWSHIGVVDTKVCTVLHENKATNLVFQKNGARTSQGAAPTYNTTFTPLTLGKSPSNLSDYFDCDIAWVAVYPRILSAA